MNDLILSQMRQRLEILYQMVNELEEGGGGSGGDSYTKAQTDMLLSYKADKSNTYTKTQTDNLLNAKANTTYVDEIFATDDITATEGQNLPSFLTDWLRLHKPINLNGDEYYFAEESGVDYVYKTIDEDGLLPRFSTAQIMKSGLTVHFYEIGVDTNPTDGSINLITSDAVQNVKETADGANTLAVDNRAAVIELINDGAKNKLSIGAPTTIPAELTCVRNNDGTYTVSGTLAAANSISFNIGAIEGDLVLSGCPAGGGDNSYLLRITKSGSQVAGSVDTGNGSDVFTMEGTDYALNIRFAAGTYTNVVFKPMICTKAAWDISQEYQPYRPNAIDAAFGPGTEIIGTSDAHEDLDNYTEPGVYFCRNSTNAGYVDNKPVGGSGFRLTVENISGTNTFRQTFIKPTDPSKTYIRHYSTSTWSSWYVFEGTVLS